MKRIEMFKVGDTVRIREWDDMAREFGVGGDGNILCRFKFVKGMRYLCGTEFVIDSISDDGIIYGLPWDERCTLSRGSWAISADMIELCEEEDDEEEFDTAEIQKFLSEFTKR